MTTIVENTFTINGIIDTNQSILSNLDKLATASGAWLTYDIHQGKWCVVINNIGTSQASFNDSNIIGSITVSSTGLTELYNMVEIEFPHKDIKDRKDYIKFTVDPSQRYPNEQDNLLTISTDIINDPIQAALIASRELKQSRIDKVVEFRTDYSYLGLKAGDIIDVTNDTYGFNQKLFRITKIAEIDQDDGVLAIAITALEYDAGVYSTSGLIRSERSVVNGIIAQRNNTAVAQSNDVSTGTQLLRLLGANAITGLINLAFSKNPITGKITQILSPKDADRDAVLSSVKRPNITISGEDSICEGATVTLTIALTNSSCACSLDVTKFSYPYQISGISDNRLVSSKTGTITLNSSGSASLSIVTRTTAANEGAETMVVTIDGVTKSITVNDALTFTYVTTASPSSVTEGASSTVTLTTTGVANGTVVPYTITGNTSRISTPISGSVTVNSNTATLSVVTINDGVYQGTGSVTVTFNSAQSDPCGQLDKTASITILDNEIAPTTCSYVSVPVVWCAQYNGNDNQLEALTPLSYANLPVPLAGEASVNVPTAVSVTKGNPSTITVTSTTAVASANNLGGSAFNVIHSFNSVSAKGLITGSHYVIYGYQ